MHPALLTRWKRYFQVCSLAVFLTALALGMLLLPPRMASLRLLRTRNPHAELIPYVTPHDKNMANNFTVSSHEWAYFAVTLHQFGPDQVSVALDNCGVDCNVLRAYVRFNTLPTETQHLGELHRYEDVHHDHQFQGVGDWEETKVMCSTAMLYIGVYNTGPATVSARLQVQHAEVALNQCTEAAIQAGVLLIVLAMAVILVPSCIVILIIYISLALKFKQQEGLHHASTLGFELADRVPPL